MNLHHQLAQAECVVEFQIVDPMTETSTWEFYEAMTIKEPTVERLIERAHMYLGRPDHKDNVAAIRLKGTMTLIHKEKDAWRPIQDSISLDLNILRERTVPIECSGRIAVGQ